MRNQDQQANERYAKELQQMQHISGVKSRMNDLKGILDQTTRQFNYAINLNAPSINAAQPDGWSIMGAALNVPLFGTRGNFFQEAAQNVEINQMAREARALDQQYQALHQILRTQANHNVVLSEVTRKQEHELELQNSNSSALGSFIFGSLQAASALHNATDSSSGRMDANQFNQNLNIGEIERSLAKLATNIQTLHQAMGEVFLHAISENNIDKAEFLCQCGVNIHHSNARGQNALELSWNQPQAFSYLIGKDKQLLNSHINHETRSSTGEVHIVRERPLRRAIREHDHTKVGLLLQHGAEVIPHDKHGPTCSKPSLIHSAVQEHDPMIVDLMLQQKDTDPNVILLETGKMSAFYAFFYKHITVPLQKTFGLTIYGQTPLHLAVESAMKENPDYEGCGSANLEIIQKLKEHGARSDIKNYDGLTVEALVQSKQQYFQEMGFTDKAQQCATILEALQTPVLDHNLTKYRATPIVIETPLPSAPPGGPSMEYNYTR